MSALLDSMHDAAVGSVEPSKSALAWPAIIAGALVAASTTLILLAIGSGLGLALASPWPRIGAATAAFTTVTAIWLITSQWIASGVGGYVAGRLRTRWVGTHTHEVFFRDTAHGFVTWAVATVVGALLLASATFSVIDTGINAASSMAAAPGSAIARPDPIPPYEMDLLLRSVRSDADPSGELRAEVGRVVVHGLAIGTLPDGDRTYLAERVASHTGITPTEAGKRVDNLMARAGAADEKARKAADAARKAGEVASILVALSMLVGAFIACVSAALGGRQRDLHI